jgi:epoxyqueuosine reductase
MGNSGNQNFIPLLVSKLGESSPYIRAMAIWALKELCNKIQFKAFRTKYAQDEHDFNVKKEWV